MPRKIKVVNLEQQQEETNESIEVDEDIQKTLDSDAALRKFLGGDTFVNDLLGVELKPVTLASLAMMQEAGCELISGKEIDEMNNVMLEILLFVYIHTEDIEKISEIISESADHQKALKITTGHLKSNKKHLKSTKKHLKSPKST